MRTLAKYIFFLVIVLGLFGCESIIDYDLPPSDPKLVLNCYFTNDSIWKVDIFKSKSIMESGDFEFVPGAQVEISNQNGTVYPLTYIGVGEYISLENAIPQIGANYTVKATRLNFEDITATAAMPSKVEIISIDTASVQNNGYPEQESKITFLDPANEKNYYSLKLNFDQVTVFQYDSLL